MWRAVWATLFIVSCAAAATECACDPEKAATLASRQCSLCREAERQPADPPVFFLKDISPRKPNRWLALPRGHGPELHHLHDMRPADRVTLWTAAIEKAKELFGPAWGVAYNGREVRTQCHAHVHIGRWLPASEKSGFVVVRSPAQISAPEGKGVWVHPVGGRLHVHAGEQVTETVLLR